MRTFEVIVEPSDILKEKTFNRIPEKLKIQTTDLRSCVGEVLIRLTRIIGNTIFFFYDFTTIRFSVTEGYKILGTYTMIIRCNNKGARISVCDHVGMYIPRLGFVVNYPKTQQAALV